MKTKIITILVLFMSLVISGCGSGQPTLSPTSTEQSPEPIVYYYFVAPEEKASEGSVMIANSVILAPTQSDITQSPDTAANIKSALDAVIHDERNLWISSDIEITNVAFSEGHADVVLQGEFFGVGDVLLIAARMQILMTVFKVPSVQSVTVTLNGDSIGNLGVSNSMEAKPADYVYTRAEIETFMAENAYAIP